MSTAMQKLKEELATADAKVDQISGELTKAVEIRNSVLDRMFETDTGFRIGGDAIQTLSYGSRPPRRVKILRLTNRDWSNGKNWWCAVQIYKKDGTLGKNEARVFSAKDELAQVDKE
ncbi:hypothetical protein LCGC14_0164560 [marine sediment metagenome]|uniref:Uncharacterized protein n=1 Tax=marine sediment metagenome TaxID=412755 RepID=A0A0F9VAP5_9ZZZZ